MRLLLVALALFAVSLQAAVEKTAVFRLTSSAFPSDQTIPKRFTADGPDLSPPLAWSGVPARTKSLALMVEDPDAPGSSPFVHWIFYGLSATATHLGEGITPSERTLKQGKNSFGSVGYRGPSPPPGKLHHYVFTLYALDADLALPAGAERGAFLTTAGAHTIAKTTLVGIYGR